MPKILRFKRPIVAITGSAGKTTTKEMLASILRIRKKVFKSIQNRNTWMNTRKYKQQISASHRAVVLEYGMLRAGQIKKHCQYIQPNIGVVTNVGTAHIGNFGGRIIGVARAKSELIRYMNQRGALFINADDANSRLLRTRPFKGRIYKVGIHNPANFKATNIQHEAGGVSFDISLQGNVHTFYIPVPGEHNVYNALFAIGVAHCLGYSPADIRTGLKRFARPKRRLSTYRGRDGVTVVDDTYSANPNAVKAAIDVLVQHQGKKIAVLGSMLEMGKYVVRGHKNVGRYLADKGVDYLFTIGNSARHIKRGAVEAGFPAANAIHCRTRKELHRHLLQAIEPNTMVLVKGSHKMNMDRTASFLRKKFARQTAPRAAS
ncbi:MAG: UDP-N-acetylmuramoyl-tripeptide--D-alanyl-D-alanine ligase [Brevibacillus sp.]|nr:UDP-N-acetylmuramoyl-tripeptide--D-alanyl-D-alanine ligase [Brevibacillus sp.]